MLTKAYEIGLTTAQFWRLTPLEFRRIRKAYNTRNRAAGLYFRENFALLYNINRPKDAPALSGTDILALPDDPKPRRKRTVKRKPMTEQEVADVMALYQRNQPETWAQPEP